MGTRSTVVGPRGVQMAQRAYSAKISAVAWNFQIGRLAAKEASLKVQGALVEFAAESGLAEAYRVRAKQLLERTLDRMTTARILFGT